MWLVWILLAYGIGSLSFGVLYSLWRGEDIRRFDAPGASGIYRRYGIAAALLVFILDVLKGSLAVGLLQLFAPTLNLLGIPLTAWVLAAVMLGHSYPVFFGFRGGAGLATGLGALLLAHPASCALFLGLGLPFLALYAKVLRPHWQLKLFAIPAASAFATLGSLGVAVVWPYGGVGSLLALALALIVRAVHLMYYPETDADSTTE